MLSISHQLSWVSVSPLTPQCPPLLFVLHSSWNRAIWSVEGNVKNWADREGGCVRATWYGGGVRKVFRRNDPKWMKRARLGDASPPRLEKEKEGRARKKERRAERKRGGESGGEAWSGWDSEKESRWRFTAGFPASYKNILNKTTRPLWDHTFLLRYLLDLCGRWT